MFLQKKISPFLFMVPGIYITPMLTQHVRATVTGAFILIHFLRPCESSLVSHYRGFITAGKGTWTCQLVTECREITPLNISAGFNTRKCTSPGTLSAPYFSLCAAGLLQPRPEQHRCWKTENKWIRLDLTESLSIPLFLSLAIKKLFWLWCHTVGLN